MVAVAATEETSVPTISAGTHLLRCVPEEVAVRLDYSVGRFRRQVGEHRGQHHRQRQIGYRPRLAFFLKQGENLLGKLAGLLHLLVFVVSHLYCVYSLFIGFNCGEITGIKPTDFGRF